MTEQKRTQQRFEVEHTVFIELVSPRMGNNESGKVTKCKTLDISGDGLRVSLEQELTVGAILQIGMQVPESPDTLYLAGEVRWCNADENVAQRWTAGFKLMNAENSDIQSWIALVAKMES